MDLNRIDIEVVENGFVIQFMGDDDSDTYESKTYVSYTKDGLLAILTELITGDFTPVIPREQYPNTEVRVIDGNKETEDNE
jgi:hypothetical protein